MSVPAMRAESVLETVLYADDLDAVEQFYGGVLGLEKITRDPVRHVFFRCGAQVLLIFNPHETEMTVTGGLPVPGHGAHGPGHVCFRADGDAIVRWRGHLEAAGIEIESDMVWPGGGRSIYFRDPVGNCLEFAEPKIWGL
ncbi:MAG: VOC family protein [Alphaproteobacteria bacterium]